MPIIILTLSLTPSIPHSTMTKKSRIFVLAAIAILTQSPISDAFSPALHCRHCDGHSIRSTISRPSLPSSLSSSTTEYGVDMDQNAMMESDMLITVDIHDVLVDAGPCSKKKAHAFSKDQPRGVLHRAFSFFLFNQQGKMLLTQRANDKITFPSVWTNTCCSHPLWGATPNEVDIVPDAYPQFDGIKHAAKRKLKHELGIDPEDIPHSQIQFVSRFQYWASDTLTHGPDAPWGEHEVDYILFLQTSLEPPLAPNPEEVADFKYVSIAEMKDMMQDPELLWSPWFLGIMDRGGFDWWEDLENSLAGKNTNEDVVFFDPAPEHVANYNLASHTRLTGVSSKKTETTN